MHQPSLCPERFLWSSSHIQDSLSWSWGHRPVTWLLSTWLVISLLYTCHRHFHRYHVDSVIVNYNIFIVNCNIFIVNCIIFIVNCNIFIVNCNIFIVNYNIFIVNCNILYIILIAIVASNSYQSLIHCSIFILFLDCLMGNTHMLLMLVI